MCRDSGAIDPGVGDRYLETGVGDSRVSLVEALLRHVTTVGR
jgi:hypothetical protein